MKMSGCAIGFEHLFDHGHDHDYHSRHGHGHHGFGPFGHGHHGFRTHGHHGHHGFRTHGHHGHHGFRPHGHHGHHGFGHPGFDRGPRSPPPINFGRNGFEIHGSRPGGCGKHEYRGRNTCDRPKINQNFDRFVDRHGFEWRLYIDGDISATEKEHSDHDDDDKNRNEIMHSSDSECEFSRRCWKKRGGHKFGMRHGRRCIVKRKDETIRGCTCGNTGKAKEPMRQEANLMTTEENASGALDGTMGEGELEGEPERPTTV